VRAAVAADPDEPAVDATERLAPEEGEVNGRTRPPMEDEWHCEGRIALSTTTTPLQDQLEADFTRLAQQAKANGLWPWFEQMVKRVMQAVAGMGPIPPIVPPPADPLPVPIVPLMSRREVGEAAD
jgi:hypothetical protein